jgi:hypothetical protein
MVPADDTVNPWPGWAGGCFFIPGPQLISFLAGDNETRGWRYEEFDRIGVSPGTPAVNKGNQSDDFNEDTGLMDDFLGMRKK